MNKDKLIKNQREEIKSLKELIKEQQEHIHTIRTRNETLWNALRQIIKDAKERWSKF